MMYRRYRDRYREYRHRRRTTQPRRRSVLMRPSVQITILLAAGLIIYIILQSAGK
jgi:hypothetical protein